MNEGVKECHWSKNSVIDPRLDRGQSMSTNIMCDSEGRVLSYTKSVSDGPVKLVTIEALWSAFCQSDFMVDMLGETSKLAEGVAPYYVEYESQRLGYVNSPEYSKMLKIRVYGEENQLIWGKVSIDGKTISKYVLGDDVGNEFWISGTVPSLEMLFKTIDPNFVPPEYEGGCDYEETCHSTTEHLK